MQEADSSPGAGAHGSDRGCFCSSQRVQRGSSLTASSLCAALSHYAAALLSPLRQALDRLNQRGVQVRPRRHLALQLVDLLHDLHAWWGDR